MLLSRRCLAVGSEGERVLRRVLRRGFLEGGPQEEGASRRGGFKKRVLGRGPSRRGLEGRNTPFWRVRPPKA